MPRRLPLLVPVATLLLLSACSGDTPVTARRGAPPAPAAECSGGMVGSDGRCVYPNP